MDVTGSSYFVLNSLVRYGLHYFGGRASLYAYIIVGIFAWEQFLQATRHHLSARRL